MAAALPLTMEFPKSVASAGEVSGMAVHCVGSAPCAREENIPPVSCKNGEFGSVVCVA